MFKQYGGLALAVKTYWKDYGGWADLIQSPIFHVSLFVAILEQFKLVHIDWRVLTIGMMPTILGFSLAAYAITFSLMGTKLHAALAKATNPDGQPLALSVNATLFHNVFIQACCLSFAVITNGSLVANIIKVTLPKHYAQEIIKIEVSLGNIVGSFFLVYAILLLFSAGLGMFRLGRLTPTTNQPTRVANDEDTPPEPEIPAKDLYGVRWTIIRAVARVLRVKG